MRRGNRAGTTWDRTAKPRRDGSATESGVSTDFAGVNGIPELSVEKYGSRTCKPNSVRRIAPVGRSFLWATHRCGALATYPKVGRTEPARARNLIRENQVSDSLPIWSCSVCGLPCPLHCCRGGALLPHLFTLTPTPKDIFRKSGRYVFCGTFRRTGLNPLSRTLSGTPLCGVRTFLSPRPAVSSEDAESDRPVQLPTESLYATVAELPILLYGTGQRQNAYLQEEADCRVCKPAAWGSTG
jgi:hypothetical protein